MMITMAQRMSMAVSWVAMHRMSSRVTVPRSEMRRMWPRPSRLWRVPQHRIQLAKRLNLSMKRRSLRVVWLMVVHVPMTRWRPKELCADPTHAASPQALVEVVRVVISAHGSSTGSSTTWTRRFADRTASEGKLHSTAVSTGGMSRLRPGAHDHVDGGRSASW
jgi:hypothetical protein